MTLIRRIIAPRKSAKLFAVAALGAIGLFGMGAAPAAASTKCVAAAETKFGRELPSTREAAVRHRARHACRVALNECAHSLNRLRRNTGRAFPYATCQVQARHRVADAYKVRCSAKAYTRRGRELSHTRAVEIRHNRKVACRVAIDRCEHRLERKRRVTGRNFRYARCEVTGSQRVAYNWDAPARPRATTAGLSFSW